MRFKKLVPGMILEKNLRFRWCKYPELFLSIIKLLQFIAVKAVSVSLDMNQHLTYAKLKLLWIDLTQNSAIIFQLHSCHQRNNWFET